MKTTPAPSIRNRRPSKAAPEIPGRTVLTPRGAIVVGIERHELPRDDVYAAYRGRILEDPIELGEGPRP